MLWGRCPWTSISSEALKWELWSGLDSEGSTVQKWGTPVCPCRRMAVARLSYSVWLQQVVAMRKRLGWRGRHDTAGWEWVSIKGLQARERSPQTMQVPLRAITGLRYCSPFCNAKPPRDLRLPQITASESQSALPSTISLCSSHLENRLLLRSCHDFSWLLLACVKIILSKHYQKNTYCSE